MGPQRVLQAILALGRISRTIGTTLGTTLGACALVLAAAAAAAAPRAYGALACGDVVPAARQAIGLSAARQAAGRPVSELPRAWAYVLLCADRDGQHDAGTSGEPPSARSWAAAACAASRST